MRWSVRPGAPVAARSTASTGSRTSSSSGASATAASNRAASRRRSPRPARGSWAPCRAPRPGCGAPRRSPPRGRGPGREVGARLGGVQRHAPGVLDAGEELLGEGQVPGCRLVALGARVRPLSGHRTDDGRPRAGVDEGALEYDVRVVAWGSIRNTLTMSGVWCPSGGRSRGSRRCWTARPRARARCGRAPRGPSRAAAPPATAPPRRPGDLEVLRPHPALDDLEELGGVDRVVRGVVDPPAPEHRVLHRADEGVVGAAERLATVGERHLVDDRLGAGLVGDDQCLDADLALGVVEPPAARRRSRGCGPWRRTSAGRPSSPGRADLGRAEGRRRDGSQPWCLRGAALEISQKKSPTPA